MSDATRAFPDAVSALPAGTRLAEFEIKSLLGVGGFGIVYLAFDHALEREVAIKEYMPASMAGRTATLHVSIRSQSDAEVFALGQRSFVNEAKLLARFDHPSLIKVHRFWEANGTAYMAMPVLRGRTFKDIRKGTGRGPDEAWIRATLVPLLGALEHLHNAGVYHRDIAPDNIHLEDEGRPVLLDFGAARRVISGKTQTLTAILKPAYAPIEQYGESSAVKQGPWTDIYALGATLHYMLLGYPPPPATVRTVSDDATALAAQVIPGVSPQLLAVVDWMLAPRPGERPQSVAELRAALDGRQPVPVRVSTPAPAPQWDKTVLSGAPSPVTIPLGDITSTTDLDLEMPALPPPAPSASRPGADGARARPQGLAHAAQAEPAMAADSGHRLHPPASRTRLLPLALAGLVLAGVAGYFAWAKLGPGQGGGAHPAAASAPAEASASHASAPQVAAPVSAATAPLAASAVAGTSNAAAAPAVGAGMPGATPGSTGGAPAGAGEAPSAGPAGAAAAQPHTSAASGAATAAGAAAMPAPGAAATVGGSATAAAPARPTRSAAPLPGTPGGPGAGAPVAGQPGARPGAAGASADRPGLPGGPAGQRSTTATSSNPAGASPAAQGAANASPATSTAPAAGPAPAAAGAGQAAAAGTGPGGPAAAGAEPGPGVAPEARCAGRNKLSHFVCMGRECARPRFKNHPECVAWRQQSMSEGGQN